MMHSMAEPHELQSDNLQRHQHVMSCRMLEKGNFESFDGAESIVRGGIQAYCNRMYNRREVDAKRRGHKVTMQRLDQGRILRPAEDAEASKGNIGLREGKDPVKVCPHVVSQP